MITRAEEFSISRVESGLFALLGVAAIGGGILLAMPFIEGAAISPLQVILLCFIGLLGLLPLGVAVERFRTQLVIAPEGVRFTRSGGLVPWAQVHGLRPSGVLGTVKVLDAAGATLGTVPRGIDRFERAFLLLSEGMTAWSGGPSGQFEGNFGGWGWFGLVGAALYLAREFHPDRLIHLQGPPLMLAGGILLFGGYKLVKLWRRTGAFAYTIDHDGIRFTGRTGDWSARWGEVHEILPLFRKADHGGAFAIVVRLTDGEYHQLPLNGVDVHGVLHALRTFGAPQAAALRPSETIDDAALLQHPLKT